MSPNERIDKLIDILYEWLAVDTGINGERTKHLLKELSDLQYQGDGE